MIDLSLYIRDGSPSCQRALDQVTRLLGRYDRARIRFTLRDVDAAPLTPDDGLIVLVPTLVIRTLSSRVQVIGELNDTTEVEDALAAAGLDSRR